MVVPARPRLGETREVRASTGGSARRLRGRSGGGVPTLLRGGDPSCMLCVALESDVRFLRREGDTWVIASA